MEPDTFIEFELTFNPSRGNYRAMLLRQAYGHMRAVFRVLVMVATFLFLLGSWAILTGIEDSDTVSNVEMGLIFLLSFVLTFWGVLEAWAQSILSPPPTFRIRLDPISIIVFRQERKIGEYAFADLGLVTKGNTTFLHCKPDNLFIPLCPGSDSNQEQFLDKLKAHLL